MKDRSAPTRSQAHEITIDASEEAVWKAIADGEELTRWFVEAAKVEPGVGGKFWLSWGGAEEGQGSDAPSSRIDVWEPNHRLRVTLMPFEMGKARYDASMAIVEDYTIERRDGKTVLRLVESGVPNNPDWDGFYDGTNAGWPQFFRTLRHYLERHPGKPRTTINIVGKLPGSLEEAWDRLTGPGGLGFEPAAGKAFSTRSGVGDAFSGEVVFSSPPKALELTLRELDDAYLAHSMASAGGAQFVYSVLSVFGKTPAEAEAIRAKWQSFLTTVLKVEAAPEGTGATC
jgi:uncharacterized protein YndB with AHSA1/START domain